MSLLIKYTTLLLIAHASLIQTQSPPVHSSASVPSNQPIRYIIKLKPNANPSAIKSLVSQFNAEKQDEHANMLGAASTLPIAPAAVVTKTFNRLNGLTGKFSTEFLDRLVQESDAVDIIEEDGIMSAAQIRRVTQSNPPSWGIRRVGQATYNGSRAMYLATPAGKGVDVYVLDTGIRITHSDFKGRANHSANFVPNEGPEDNNGHGTHVAGTIGGFQHGVAKWVSIKSVKVLDGQALGTYSQIIAGIEHVISVARPGKSIINFSISGPTSATVDAALQAAFNKGIAVIGAAGNEGRDACGNTPASAGASVFAVGASTQPDQIADFSNYGTCVRLFAPGADIYSTWNTGDSAQSYLSGTSQASPHVAGIAAMYMSMFNFTGKIPTLYNYLVATANKSVKGPVTKLATSPNLLAYDGCDPLRSFWTKYFTA